MARHHDTMRGAVAAALLAACLAGPWGCQAGKTAAAAPRDAAPPAQTQAPGKVAAPGLGDAALLARIKPFLDCTYAGFVAAQAGQTAFRPEAARASCDACASLLEPFREYVYERSGDKDYVAELTGVVRDHALRVMEAASAGSR